MFKKRFAGTCINSTSSSSCSALATIKRTCWNPDGQLALGGDGRRGLMRAYSVAVLLRDKETSEACLHEAMGKQIEKIPVRNVDAYQIRIILAIIVAPPVDG